jgi:hypothetical protein
MPSSCAAATSAPLAAPTPTTGVRRSAAKARQDKIRVITSRDGARAFAMLNRKIPDDQAMGVMRQALDQTTLLGELAQRSAELGHELGSWLGHHDESTAFCQQCGARIYIRPGAPNVQDGEPLNDSCPSPPD